MEGDCSLKNIKVSEEVYQKLMEVMGIMIQRDKKNYSIPEIIEKLCDFYLQQRG